MEEISVRLRTVVKVSKPSKFKGQFEVNMGKESLFFSL